MALYRVRMRVGMDVGGGVTGEMRGRVAWSSRPNMAVGGGRCVVSRACVPMPCPTERSQRRKQGGCHCTSDEAGKIHDVHHISL
jgi:hypothetical protein